MTTTHLEYALESIPHEDYKTFISHIREPQNEHIYEIVEKLCEATYRNAKTTQNNELGKTLLPPNTQKD